MAVPLAVPIAMAGIGLASAGVGAYMASRDQRKAERALAALGPRKSLTVPQEILDAYRERLRRYARPSGFTQAELNQMQQAQARQNATLFSRASSLGSSPAALQAIAANANALNSYNVAVANAQMKRTQSSNDLAAADALAGTISGYRFRSAAGDQEYRDLTERALGESIRTNKQSQRDMIAGIGGLAAQGAISPQMWVG
jgi:hypothetical protein